MKKRDRTARSRAKVSAMVLKIAQGYIDLGTNIHEKEIYLRSACSAWNIACLSSDEQEKTIRTFVRQFRQVNQATNEEASNFESDMRLLIEQKLTLYPDVKVPIVDCRMEVVDGKDKAWVMFIRKPANKAL